jgi:pimeloyl-ACP methyl ester carboxylesterase
MNRLNTIELDHRNADLSIDHVTTSRHSFTPNDTQRIHLIVADGRSEDQPGETVIWPASFASRADTLEYARATMLAARLQARVIYVETPGVGIDIDDPFNTSSGQPSARQLLSVARGNFDSLAKMQLDAVDSVLDLPDGQEVRLIGYSMGAWAATTIAKLLARKHFPDKQILIPRIDLIEAVNDQKYTLSDLVRNINQESQHTERYITDENRENGLSDTLLSAWNTATDDRRAIPLLNRRQNLMLKALPIGLRKGFATTLTQAVEDGVSTTRLNEGSINIWRANESVIARQEANMHTLSQLGRVAARITEIYPTVQDRMKGHHHAIVQSLGSISHLADQHLRHDPTVG